MTMRNGSAVCDRCGGDCGNGGLASAAVVSDMDERGLPVAYHLCRSGGCAAKATGKRAMPARHGRDDR